MSELNPGNEKLKRRYRHHLQEARGLASRTIDNALRAIGEFERFTSHREFGKFRSGDAERFKRHLLTNGGKRAAELSNRSTVQGKLRRLQLFFRWLAEQPGFRTKVSGSDAAFFNLSNRDAQIARDRPLKTSATLEQVQHAIRSMPASTDVERRDRALVACILLTGVRVSAAISLKLKHVRYDRQGIEQDAREVRTKFSKSYPTYFFPVGDDIRDIFLEWVDYLRNELLWNGDDPLFPTTQQEVGNACHFRTTGLTRRHWTTADPVRGAYRKAFAAAGLPYYSPHSIRRTLALLGQRICHTPEALKAWSQNLGHEDVLTTFKSYGAVSYTRQAEIIGSLGTPKAEDEVALAALRSMRGDPRLRALFGG